MSEGEPLSCLDCGLPYSSPAWADFVVADAVWETICPEPGVLCVVCMVRRATERGIEAKGAFTSGPFADHLWVKPGGPP